MGPIERGFQSLDPGLGCKALLAQFGRALVIEDRLVQRRCRPLDGSLTNASIELAHQIADFHLVALRYQPFFNGSSGLSAYRNHRIGLGATAHEQKLGPHFRRDRDVAHLEKRVVRRLPLSWRWHGVFGIGLAADHDRSGAHPPQNRAGNHQGGNV